MKSSALAACLLGIVLWHSSPARACSCAKPPEVEKAIETSTAIFVGKVSLVEQGKTGTEFNVSLEVRRAYKAIKGKSVLLFQESMCGFSFKKGKTYLVYATADDEGHLTASICSRTTLAKKASKELKILQVATAKQSTASQ